MATIHVLGRSSEDYKCAAAVADNAYRRANDLLAELLRNFATADEIPATLRISDMEPSGWHGAEVALDKAVQRGDWVAACELADAYLGRVTKFCKTWEAKIEADKKQSLPKAA